MLYYEIRLHYTLQLYFLAQGKCFDEIFFLKVDSISISFLENHIKSLVVTSTNVIITTTNQYRSHLTKPTKKLNRDMKLKKLPN